MRSAQQLKDLGIPSWYHGHARYYERLFGNLGWNETQITEALKFGASFKGGSEADLVAQFKEVAAYHDAPDLDLAIDVGLGLRDSIAMDGVESLPPLAAAEPSFTSADDARLAAIREIARNDPQAYESNQTLQDEQLALLEARQAAGGKASPGNGSASAPPAGDRLAQIREMRRNDPDGYERNAALQTEELSLIEASLPKPNLPALGAGQLSQGPRTETHTPPMESAEAL